MIELSVERLLGDTNAGNGTRRHVLLLADPSGERILALRTGPSEASRLSVALASRAQSDGSRESGTQVVIDGLADGCFQAHWIASGPDGVIEQAVRPIEGITAALEVGASIAATPEIFDAAAVSRDGLDLSEGPEQINVKFDLDPPVATFPWIFDVKSSIQFRWAMRGIALFAIGAILIGCFAITIQLAVLPVERQPGDNVGQDVIISGIFAAAFFVCGIVIWFIRRYIIRNASLVGGRVLELFPTGLKYRDGAQVAFGSWSAFLDVTPLSRVVKGHESVRFRKPFRLTGAKPWTSPILYIPLQPFDSAWPDGELRTLIRRYVPQLLGVPHPDADGGSIPF